MKSQQPPAANGHGPLEPVTDLTGALNWPLRPAAKRQDYGRFAAGHKRSVGAQFKTVTGSKGNSPLPPEAPKNLFNATPTSQPTFAIPRSPSHVPS